MAVESSTSGVVFAEAMSRIEKNVVKLLEKLIPYKNIVNNNSNLFI